MSKGFNMIGWRMAFVAGHPKIVQAFADVKDNCDSGQFMAIQQAAARGPRASGARRPHPREVPPPLAEAGGGARQGRLPGEDAGRHLLPLRASAPKGCGGRTFANAEEASQFLIHEQSVICVPWDNAGPFLRFSVTYLARTRRRTRHGRNGRRLAGWSCAFRKGEPSPVRGRVVRGLAARLLGAAGLLGGSCVTQPGPLRGSARHCPHFPETAMMCIFLTGGTGLVGGVLVERLAGRGDHVVLLMTPSGRGGQAVAGRPASPSSPAIRCSRPALEGTPSRAATASCIWPARGFSIAAGARSSRNSIRSAAIKAPRTSSPPWPRQPTAHDGIAEAAGQRLAPIGIYGPHGDEELSEDSPAGQRLPCPSLR